MKLIDLLVQELPKRGGWPDGADGVVQDADDLELYFFIGGPVVNSGESWWFEEAIESSRWIFSAIRFELADDHDKSIITLAQYEAALQQPVWNGEGLPPVGTECEWFDSSSKDGWTKVKVMYLSKWVIVLQSIESNFGHGVDVARDLVLDKVREFRPLRTDAKGKWDAFAEAVTDRTVMGDSWQMLHVGYDLYDAIAAGRIPGVKLDD